MYPADLLEQTRLLLDLCRQKGWKIATAESCTGGLISGLLTAVPGSSDVFAAGFVAYSNEAKHSMLGIEEPLIASHGAVSPEVAEEMALRAMEKAQTSLSIATTGIAGPGGGSQEKPVGLVHIAVASQEKGPCVMQYNFPGDRDQVRLSATGAAMHQLKVWVTS